MLFPTLCNSFHARRGGLGWVGWLARRKRPRAGEGKKGWDPLSCDFERIHMQGKGKERIRYGFRLISKGVEGLVWVDLRRGP